LEVSKQFFIKKSIGYLTDAFGVFFILKCDIFDSSLLFLIKQTAYRKVNISLFYMHFLPKRRYHSNPPFLWLFFLVFLFEFF